MPDLPSVTNFINSPPGQLVAGAVLAGIVWKFFDKVEAVLTDQTKNEMATWLLSDRSLNIPAIDVNLPNIELWMPSVEFTERWTVLLNEDWLKNIWKILGLLTSILAIASLLVPNSISRKILAVYMQKGGFEASNFFGLLFFVSLFAALGTHSAIYMAQWLLRRIGAMKSEEHLLLSFGLSLTLTPIFVLLGTLFLLMLGSFDRDVMKAVETAFSDRLPTLSEMRSISLLVFWKTLPFGFVMIPMVLANALSALWVLASLLLYSLTTNYKFFVRTVRNISKLLVHCGMGFNAAFGWFTRRFDIEKKPLSAIGLVAGSLVAILYWAWVGFRHFHPA